MYPILALFVRNSREVRVAELKPLLLFAVLGVSVIWLLFGLLMRDIRKAGLVASLGVAFFFTVGQAMLPANVIASILGELWIQNGYPDLDRLWVVIPECIVLVIVAVLLARWVKDSRTLTGFLDVFAIVLVAMPAFQILSMESVGTVPRPSRRPVPFALGSRPLEGKPPDIYYIILDGYARSDVMKSLFDYDNSGFLDRLERKGFYVASGSTANYCQTPLCLSSSLNSSYLDEMVKGLGIDQTELTQFIARNDVVASLRPLGYRSVTFATGFDPTENPEADSYLTPHVLVSNFERMLIDMTPIQRVLPSPRWEDSIHAGARANPLSAGSPAGRRSQSGPDVHVRPYPLPAPPVRLRRGRRGRQSPEIRLFPRRPRSHPWPLPGAGRFPTILSGSGGVHHAEDRGDDRSTPGRVSRAAHHHPPIGPRLGAVPGFQQREPYRFARADEHPERLLLPRPAI